MAYMCFMILGGVGKQEMVLNQAQMYKVNVNETCYTMKPTSTLKFQYGYLYTLVPAVFLTIYVSNFLTYHFLSCQASFEKPPNVSTTPITAMGCRQCLFLSVVQLKGKLCRTPHCRNVVVDTFGPCITLVKSNPFIHPSRALWIIDTPDFDNLGHECSPDFVSIIQVICLPLTPQ